MPTPDQLIATFTTSLDTVLAPPDDNQAEADLLVAAAAVAKYPEAAACLDAQLHAAETTATTKDRST